MSTKALRQKRLSTVRNDNELTELEKDIPAVKRQKKEKTHFNNGTQMQIILEIYNEIKTLRKDFNIHRNRDQPAIIDSNGNQCWYKEGLLHRDGDQPARIDPNGNQWWYKEGKRHREGDRPAVIFANGDKMWYKEGKQHREGDNRQ